ncbi:hypothetical protein EVAR_60454_1 [Eumeta japonica]|uniref:Uncharacterized protein n=1 Tax=Eumeta variegata TaxID=151549 RepID=A0A4C1Z511_EUMVA|nr:hypothetical protein EVAR_60454_1 [Eumeta japonica]
MLRCLAVQQYAERSRALELATCVNAMQMCRGRKEKDYERIGNRLKGYPLPIQTRKAVSFAIAESSQSAVESSQSSGQQSDQRPAALRLSSLRSIENQSGELRGRDTILCRRGIKTE